MIDPIWIVWGFIVAAAFGVHWLLVRPFLRRLEDRIPHGSEYRASVAPKDQAARRPAR